MAKNKIERNRTKATLIGSILIVIVILSIYFSLNDPTLTGNAIVNQPQASRTLPATYSSGTPFTVSISASLDASACGIALVEKIPAGFSVSNILGDGSGLYNNSSNSIIWAPVYGPFCGGATDYNFSYVLTPNSGTSGTKTFSGSLAVDGYVYSITGSNSISTNTPLYTIYSPVAKSYSASAVPINVSISRIVPALKYYDFTRKRGGSFCSNCNQWGLTTLKTLSLAEGTHVFNIYSTDNFVNQTVSLFVDYTAPRIISVAPTNGSSCASTFYVKYTENYPKNVTLYYGANSIVKSDCPAGTKKNCYFTPSFSGYSAGTKVQYSYEVRDTFRSAVSAKYTCTV